MKRKLLAMVCAVSMIASLGAATVYASDDVKATGDEKIALITMDSIDQHWITLNEGAQEEAKELGVTVDCKCRGRSYFLHRQQSSWNNSRRRDEEGS